MKIPYVNLKRQFLEERKELLKVIDKSLLSGKYVTNSDQVKIFEEKVSKICGTKYCLSLNSGTDALTLGLHCLGVKRGDEVITTSNSFIASTAVIVHLGAIPVFVDVKNDQNINEELIEKKISKKTKAIMAVHLTGRMCNMRKIVQISKKYNIPIIEDAAQAIFSAYLGKKSGSYGKVGCFSSHPLKNLNSMGDGGYLVTDDKKIYEKIFDLRNHGMSNRNIVKNFGYVSRMDNLQAAILNYRLKNLKEIIRSRRKNFKIYAKNLNTKFIYFPEEKKEEFNTYHTFVIQVKHRDKLKRFLNSNKIETTIHYPIPIHMQPAYKKMNFKKQILPVTEKQAKTILTLPINQFITKRNIELICNKVNKFYEQKLYL
tara:strand:+ start:6982 stop:8097 length:1116 start_codon:yes stop_codon:yes gene_type:complete